MKTKDEITIDGETYVRKENMIIKSLREERNRLVKEIYKIDEIIWTSLKKHRVQLDKRSYLILKGRLYEKKGYEKMGQEFDVTRERIRQLEEKAVDHLDDMIEDNEEEIKNIFSKLESD